MLRALPLPLERLAYSRELNQFIKIIRNQRSIFRFLQSNKNVL